jgi:viroplasmin and RNaseH domain-containing protein
MASYYVIFNGKHAGPYMTWGECSKYVVGVRGARYKKYNNYEQAYREFQAAMGDAYPANEPAPVLPYDPVPHDAFCPFIFTF